jgi:DNA-binding NtrC family response regulator
MVVDDEPSMRRLLRIMLEGEGYRVFDTDDGNEALRRAAAEHWDVVIQDVRMPKMDGLTLLANLQKLESPPLVLVVTAFSTWDDAVQAMRLGAHDYIKKPFDNDHIRVTVAQAIGRRRLQQKLVAAGAEGVPNVGNLIGNSAAIQQVTWLIQRAAPTDSTIVIRGESGTGKELVARAIHYGSFRAQEPFIPVNCGAFAESLLESELFGHVRGSFTGAVADKKGLLEIADHGTFFLDEVAEMSPATQVKLLRVLENREFKPVGSVKTKTVDVRFITATNQDLEKLVADGGFREDLYYRLNVIPIVIPPLRERRTDIPLLAGHFLAMYSRRMRKKVTKIDDAALELLMAYDWPGNVRELENMVERAVALIDGEIVSRDDLAGRILQPNPPCREVDLDSGGVDLERALAEVERRYIESALKSTKGNLTRAAELLKIPFRSIRYRVKKLGISKAGERAADQGDAGAG